MFNRQEYVNWLQGVANHEKPNLHIHNNVTNSQSNEPIKIDEGIWGGIDKVRRGVEKGTAKVTGWADKANKSRFGTSFNAVGAKSRQRSQSFYGHGPAKDTGFGKPVGYDDAATIKRDQDYRDAADKEAGRQARVRSFGDKRMDIMKQKDAGTYKSAPERRAAKRKAEAKKKAAEAEKYSTATAPDAIPASIRKKSQPDFTLMNKKMREIGRTYGSEKAARQAMGTEKFNKFKRAYAAARRGERITDYVKSQGSHETLRRRLGPEKYGKLARTFKAAHQTTGLLPRR